MKLVNNFSHVVIGITGGIAAYKSLSLIRLFKNYGCEVRVIATAHALEFVTPLSIETLSQHRVYVDSFNQSFNYEVDHVALADWADVVVIAPATANILAKYAHGIADDFLSTFLLAYRKRLFIAPSMNDKMFTHVTVQNNLNVLRKRGCYIIEPTVGNLACGTSGKGRMEEPERIFEIVKQSFDEDKPLKGKKAVVTAGPTYEPIDPVRFLGNYSSGRMGFAIAEVLEKQGAEVTLIAGPTLIQLSSKTIRRVNVQTAAEMYDETMRYVPSTDFIIMAAAVADYTPLMKKNQKIKKNDEKWSLNLTKTTDILAKMGAEKQKNQILVGFALETENELPNAIKKLENKNLDFIVLNSLSDEGAGFGVKTNKITIIDKNKVITEGVKKDKYLVAQDIVNEVIKLFSHEEI